LERDGFGKLFGGTTGAVFLYKVENNAGENDRNNDEKARGVAGHCGEYGGGEKNQDEWISEVRKELDDDGAVLTASDNVGTELGEAGGGFGGSKAGGRRRNRSRCHSSTLARRERVTRRVR
jgi:hypothetical protein